jgi:hypothetical protein
VSGWTLLDLDDLARTPGVHDVGARLGVSWATILLVVLRAAERWSASNVNAATEMTVLHREGRALLERADGSTEMLDGQVPLSATAQPIVGLVNPDVALAQVLLIAR